VRRVRLAGVAEAAGGGPGGVVLMAAGTRTVRGAARLAWRNLTAEPRRLALSLAGVGFAVVLMAVEAGFYHALLDASVALIDRFDADLVMVSKVKTSLQAHGGFPRRRLVQALGVPGVAEVRPLYLEEGRSVWRADAAHFRAAPDPAGRRPRRKPIRALGVDADAPGLRLGAVRGDGGALWLPDRVLLDLASDPGFGRPGDGADGDELAGRDVTVAGTFDLGRDFVHEGNVVLGEAAWAHYFPVRGGSALRTVEAGLIKLADGADPREVQARLRELRAGVPADRRDPRGGDDVRVLTVAEFRDQERAFWLGSTPIGFVFGLGLAMGLTVGLVICYQILSTDVTERLGEYATLKAMGYTDRYLGGVVLLQALCLALAGFGPGLAVSAAVYAALGAVTGLPVFLTVGRAAFVLLLTAGMCAASGLVTVRKVQTADPAALF
jgi:putative ABC transport system permease protein